MQLATSLAVLVLARHHALDVLKTAFRIGIDELEEEEEKCSEDDKPDNREKRNQKAEREATPDTPGNRQSITRSQSCPTHK
jgi:hypothetical protein